MKTRYNGLGSFELSQSAKGSPIRFHWTGATFLTVDEAKKAVKNLSNMIKKAQPKATKKSKKNGRK